MTTIRRRRGASTFQPVASLAPTRGDLRRPLAPLASRLVEGKALREVAPRSSHAAWRPDRDRPDPLRTVLATNAGRQSELVRLRLARMAASPFAWLRGAAAVMAWDLARLPVSGLPVVVDGDAHLANFGLYGTPQREVVFDLNEGARVVHGQRILQASADPLLGFTRIGSRDFYVRQLRNMKASVPLRWRSASRFATYAASCGAILARAHARSGDAAAIAGYCGRATVLDEALADFAATYGEEVVRDHAVFARAVRRRPGTH